MKFNATFALIVICGLAAYSQALPTKRLTFYQQPAAGRHYSAPQRVMFMRYVQPSSYSSYGHAARSHHGAAALVAGNSGATGTYLEGSSSDGVYAASAQEESIAASANEHSAHSVAEAYPAAHANAGGGAADSLGAASSAEQETKVTVQVDLDPVSSAEGHEAKTPREYNYDAAVAGSNAAGVGVVGAGVNGGFATGDVASEVHSSDASAAEAGGAAVTVGFSGADDDEVSVPVPSPIAPVTSSTKRNSASKKKVIVELEQAAEADSDNAIAAQNDDEVQDDSEYDEAYVPVPVAPKVPARRRPVVRKPSNTAAKPQPVGTFFPVHFGGTDGGAIAIANSFSTGEGGSATSHAVAYGNPDQARAHLRPSRRH